jgi:hypothetical protein
MATINQIMHVAFYVLLALSGITIISLIFFVTIRSIKKRDYIVPKVIAAWAGIATSVGSFSLAILNFNFPIGILPESDPAYNAIKTFYNSIQARNCDAAWNLIHGARKKILAEEYNFGRDQFCEAYKTTQTYDGLEITREDKNSSGMSSRDYRVTYDVFDNLPRNNLYDLHLKDFSDVVRLGPWDEKHLLDEIIENLRLYFVVPEEDVPSIKDIIARTPFWYIADPEMISELQRLLNLKYHIVLKTVSTPPPFRRVPRHYVHRITMMLDEGQWKIRDGLAQPVLVAPIVPRDKIL